MEIKLDYNRMADTVYALAALKTFETGAERVIGRNEEAALLRMFARALLDVSLHLGRQVKAIDSQAGRIEIDSAEPLLHRLVESAVLHSVLLELNLTDAEPDVYLRTIRGLLRTLPRLAKE